MLFLLPHVEADALRRHRGRDGSRPVALFAAISDDLLRRVEVEVLRKLLEALLAATTGLRSSNA
jgi:hypothetical protein